MPSSPSSHPTDWRCRTCSTLLGVARGDEIDIRYKTAHYTVRGEATAYCRRCGTDNHISSTNGTALTSCSPPPLAFPIP